MNIFHAWQLKAFASFPRQDERKKILKILSGTFHIREAYPERKKFFRFSAFKLRSLVLN